MKELFLSLFRDAVDQGLLEIAQMLVDAGADSYDKSN